MTASPSITTGSSVTSIAAPVLPLAAAGAALGAVATAVGTFTDLTGNSSNDYGAKEYALDLGLIAVATAVVFGLVVRTAHRGDPGRRALVLGLLSLPAVLVYWSGLPYVLAAGAVACAVAARRSGRPSIAALASALAAVSALAALFFAVTG